MNAISEFFGCCSKDNKQIEVTIHLTQKRSQSEGTRTARIQRSVKHKNFDLSTRHSQGGSHTQIASSHSNIPNRISMYSRTSYPLATGQKQNIFTSQKIVPINKIMFRNDSGRASSPKCDNFQSHQPIFIPQHYPNRIEDTKINEHFPSSRAQTPRLLLDRRVRKAKEEGMTEALNINEQSQYQRQILRYKSPFVKSVLETIEERISLPSCSQSQIKEINRIPSRSFFLDQNQQNQRLPEILHLNQKFNSCIIRNKNHEQSGLNRARSELIYKFQQKLSKQHQKLIQNKLKVDIQIYQKELKVLLQEQKYLLDQSLFANQQFKTTLQRLSDTKEQLLLNLQKLEQKAYKERFPFLMKRDND